MHSLQFPPEFDQTLAQHVSRTEFEVFDFRIEYSLERQFSDAWVSRGKYHLDLRKKKPPILENGIGGSVIMLLRECYETLALCCSSGFTSPDFGRFAPSVNRNASVFLFNFTLMMLP